MKPATDSKVRSLFRPCFCLFASARLIGLPAAAAALFSGQVLGSVADFVFTEHEDSITITGYSGTTSGVVVVNVPETINDKPVKAIGNGAFANKFLFFAGTTSASVNLPDSIEIIGNNAFNFSSSLTSITLSSSLVSIGDNAFQNCSNLPSISLPATLQSIGAFAFDNCINLANLTLPAGLTHLGAAAFQNCSKITSITMPAGITSIFPSTFQNCTALTSVTLPTGLTLIGQSAFQSCSNLTAITIPAGVTQIGQQAFRFCSKLATATFRGDAPVEFGSNVFTSTAAGFKIQYYAVTTGFTNPTWKGYATVELGDNTLESWREFYDVPTDATLGEDLNGDGITLLMAYALTLDPNRTLSGAMPMPTVNETADTMSLNFQSRAFGVTYVVETTADFLSWTTNEVTISEPDDGGFRTASVAIDGTPRFLRLGVSYGLPDLD